MEHNADTHSLQCPKCQHGMEEITHGGVTIDRCSNCHGLWFDGDEMHQLRDIVDSQVLDTGDPEVGQKYDSRVDINCPRCGKGMIKSADDKQIHIWYEVCEDHGIFLDAGEFADLKDESILDWFRGLIKGDRNIVAP